MSRKQKMDHGMRIMTIPCAKYSSFKSKGFLPWSVYAYFFWGSVSSKNQTVPTIVLIKRHRPKNKVPFVIVAYLNIVVTGKRIVKASSTYCITRNTLKELGAVFQ